MDSALAISLMGVTEPPVSPRALREALSAPVGSTAGFVWVPLTCPPELLAEHPEASVRALWTVSLLDCLVSEPSTSREG